MASRGWRAGTARRAARRSSRSRSIRCWSKRCSPPAPSAPRAARLAALLHDAPEYVIGDMISPFKAAVGGDYKQVEERLLTAIFVRFGLPRATPPISPRRSSRPTGVAAYLEATALAGFAVAEARKFFGAPNLALEALRRLSAAAAAGGGAGSVSRPFRRARRRGSALAPPRELLDAAHSRLFARAASRRRSPQPARVRW